MSLPKLVVITGPTASGKTALSLRLAKRFNGEIISADSQQIYRGMDIGTAKAPKKELKSVPHHLIDIRDPNQSYTLAQFKTDATYAIKQIQRRGRIPFLVGGTALYIWAILENPEIPEVKPNRKLRSLLERQLSHRGVSYLYKKLVQQDPEAVYIIDPKNPRRIIRALEIMHATGKPFSATRKKGPKLFDTLVLGLTTQPAKLKKQIDKRAAGQIKDGLVSEVKKLVKKYGKNKQAFDAIGYREIISYLNGQISRAEALKQIQNNTWHFAGRQMTWFKKLPIRWIKVQSEAEKKIKNFLKKKRIELTRSLVSR